MDQPPSEAQPIAQTLNIVPTIFPASPPLEETTHPFWLAGEGLADIDIQVEPPASPLAVLEKLGPSPFERAGFPLIGFLATTYDKVSRFALDRK